MFSKNISFCKFFFNLPFKFYVTPDNIINLFYKKKVKKIDLICIDIDSYDYFVAKKILETELSPTLFIIEYNSNLPINSELTLTFGQKRKNSNKRIYGASFLAIYKLFKKIIINLFTYLVFVIFFSLRMNLEIILLNQIILVKSLKMMKKLRNIL